MDKKLLILGTGQYANVVKEVAESMECYERIEQFDISRYEELINGDMHCLSNYQAERYEVVVAVENNEFRLKLLQELEGNFRLATVIHKSAVTSIKSRILGGCVVEPLAVIHPNTIIGKGCLISAGAVVNHDSAVEAGCHIDCNATIASNAHVPKCTKVECGMVWKQRKEIQEYSFECGV